MPKRPRQHQLEDQSRVAFRTALPSEWVFRDSQPDYGIDGEVEIFDKAGVATGRRFLVQLKATDQPDLDRALAVLFRLETCHYYKSLDLPVLIVRYRAPTRKLYVKWFHSLDPYYGKTTQKSITFRLTPEDEWDDGTGARLVSDLEAIRQIRSPQIALPLLFTLKLTEPQIHGVPAAQIASGIREAAGRLPAIITIGSSLSGHTRTSIAVGNDKTVIDLAGVAGLTLHTSPRYPAELALAQFPYDVLVGVAVALDCAGHSNVAAQLVAEFAARSSLIKNPEVVVRLACCMARAHRVTEALQLSEMLFENEGSLDAAQILLVTPLLQGDSLSYSEREYLRGFMRRRIERAEQSGERQRAALSHYNYGNYLRGEGHHRLAFHHYKKAVKYDATYLERRYFCRELAGILFEGGRYSLAVSFYDRAISLGEEGYCRALQADALMFAGRYREAQEALEAYLRLAADAAPEWRLKAWALSGLRRMLGRDEQERRSVKAIEFSTPDATLSIEESRRRLEEALRHDALCGLAWFNLGVLQSQSGRRDDAFAAFLMAALTRRGDVEAWCNAMALGMDSKEHLSLVSNIVEAAYRSNGERFAEEVVRFARSQPAGFPVNEFVNAVDSILSQLPRERRPVELRLLKDGSNYDLIPLRPIDQNPKKAG